VANVATCTSTPRSARRSSTCPMSGGGMASVPRRVQWGVSAAVGLTAGSVILVSRFQVMSDGQWSLIEGMLPHPTGRPRRKFSDARTMVEAIIYRYRTGIAWRDQPEVFGPWQTVWTWHHRMAADGTWDRVLAKVTADRGLARTRSGATKRTRLARSVATSAPAGSRPSSPNRTIRRGTGSGEDHAEADPSDSTPSTTATGT